MKTMVYLLTIFAVLSAAGLGAAQTIDVGEGCNYTTIAEGVNAASFGDLVLVHEGIYSINSSILGKTGVSVSGEGGNKTIIYTDSAEDISSENNPAMIYLDGVSGIKISNLTFLGPARTREEQHENGGTSAIGGLREARNGIKLHDASNIIISDCYFTMLYSDAIRNTGAKDVKVFDCEFNSAGHDAISLFNSTGIIDNCKFNLMINTCIRLDGVTQATIANSTFSQTDAGTGAGFIELENIADNVLITKNVFLESEDPVLWLANPEGGKVQLIDNAFYGVAGPSTSYGPYNITVRNNTQYASVRDWASMGYGYSEEVTTEETTEETTENVIKWVDDGKDEHCSEEVVVSAVNSSVETINETTIEIVNIITEGNSTINSTAVNNTVLNNICAMYLDFSSENALTAAIVTNESVVDIEQAKILLNGSEEEQVLGQKYIQSSELKLQYAQDMLNLSQDSIKELKGKLNSSEG